jgi:exosome complex RNA-binding protein Rrp42 (RNase PH superfamily)
MHCPSHCGFVLQDGELLVLDPNDREEAAAAGAMTVVLNTHSDVCTVRKCSGVGISMTQVQPRLWDAVSLVNLLNLHVAALRR